MSATTHRRPRRAQFRDAARCPLAVAACAILFVSRAAIGIGILWRSVGRRHGRGPGNFGFHCEAQLDYGTGLSSSARLPGARRHRVPSGWQQVREIPDRGIALPGSERTACLEVACSPDPSLRSEVESLLRSTKPLAALSWRSPAIDFKSVVAESAPGARFMIAMTSAFLLMRSALGLLAAFFRCPASSQAWLS